MYWWKLRLAVQSKLGLVFSMISRLSEILSASRVCSAFIPDLLNQSFGRGVYMVTYEALKRVQRTEEVGHSCLSCSGCGRSKHQLSPFQGAILT